jgi:hypothetical protein
MRYLVLNSSKRADRSRRTTWSRTTSFDPKEDVLLYRQIRELRVVAEEVEEEEPGSSGRSDGRTLVEECREVEAGIVSIRS